MKVSTALKISIHQWQYKYLKGSVIRLTIRIIPSYAAYTSRGVSLNHEAV
jgi:hypothetical protein